MQQLPQLDDIEDRFVLEYMKDLKGGRAAQRVGIKPSYARQWASRKLQEPHIAARVAQLKAKYLARLDLSVEQLMDRLARIAMTDAAELVEFRRVCCRHCWGKNFGYQRTDGALFMDRRRHEERVKELQAEGGDLVAEIPEFDEMGGGGFDAAADPNPECPECSGEGVGMPFLKDTRDLGPYAAAAFAGLKVTKDGIEVKTYDAVKAIELLGKHKGAFVERVEHKHTITSLAQRMRGRTNEPGSDLA